MRQSHWNLSKHHGTILFGGLRGALTWSAIMPRDASLSDSRERKIYAENCRGNLLRPQEINENIGHHRGFSGAWILYNINNIIIRINHCKYRTEGYKQLSINKLNNNISISCRRRRRKKKKISGENPNPERNDHKRTMRIVPKRRAPFEHATITVRCEGPEPVNTTRNDGEYDGQIWLEMMRNMTAKYDGNDGEYDG